MFLFKKLLWIAVKFLIRLRFPKVSRISTADLAAWLEEDEAEKPLLLDVRTPENMLSATFKEQS